MSSERGIVKFMKRYFNIEGSCNKTEHYMVNLEIRLRKIKNLVDNGKYFSINRARQYGKTTTLDALADYLQNEYLVIYLDFQMLGREDFKCESNFVSAFSREILLSLSYSSDIPNEVLEKLRSFSEVNSTSNTLSLLFVLLSKWCAISEKSIVLIIDEVDSATNNQVFLDFLSQLRGYYLHRKKRDTFQSVILAGVYDVKNLRQKLRNDKEHKTNSPWNIAAKFDVEMSFSVQAIEDMLSEYEQDYHTGMNIEQMAKLIYDYTSGYPVLVSGLCKIIDEDIAENVKFPNHSDAWKKDGFLEAVKVILNEKNTLFESMINKLQEYPELRQMIHEILFQGVSIAYNPDNYAIDIGMMFGFLKQENEFVKISNRIFETRFYNFFLSEEREKVPELYKIAVTEKNKFIKNGTLDMKMILEHFIQSFSDIYGNQNEKFLEEDGRRYFLLFLRPIINGTGNYYIESQTRDSKRTDVIVDYLGKQYIIELKIWRGEEYNKRGIEQLGDYLDAYHQKTGYMLSFNFNKNKKTGIKEINSGDKLIVEAVV